MYSGDMVAELTEMVTRAEMQAGCRRAGPRSEVSQKSGHTPALPATGRAAELESAEDPIFLQEIGAV